MEKSELKVNALHWIRELKDVAECAYYNVEEDEDWDSALCALDDVGSLLARAMTSVEALEFQDEQG